MVNNNNNRIVKFTDERGHSFYRKAKLKIDTPDECIYVSSAEQACATLNELVPESNISAHQVYNLFDMNRPNGLLRNKLPKHIKLSRMP